MSFSGGRKESRVIGMRSRAVTAWGAVVLVLALGRAAVAQKAVTPKDLEGVWTGARFTEGRGEDEKKGVKLILTFKDNLLAVQKASRSLVGKASFKIAADGKSIDATGLTGGYRRKTYFGILKIEGDTLYWCTSGTSNRNQKRPTGYVANPGSAQYLIVARRRKSR